MAADTDARMALHRLIDELPESELQGALGNLQRLRAHWGGDDYSQGEVVWERARARLLEDGRLVVHIEGPLFGPPEGRTGASRTEEMSATPSPPGSSSRGEPPSLKQPVSTLSGAIGIGLIGAGVAGPLGAAIGMALGGLVGHMIHHRGASAAA